MDENTRIVVSNAVKLEKWEDVEKSTGDVDILVAEFKKRLETPKENDSSINEDRRSLTGIE